MKIQILPEELKEFRPALKFVGVFLGIYLLGNIAYGVYIETFRPAADPATIFATGQSAAITNYFTPGVTIKPLATEPSVYINQGDSIILNVFEGCNGINVMIVFISFVVAYGGSVGRMSWFIASGIVLIHLFNLLRLNLLFYTAIRWPNYFYYFHKYLFTACLYLIVFVLWFIWMRLGSGKKETHASA